MTPPAGRTQRVENPQKRIFPSRSNSALVHKLDTFEAGAAPLEDSGATYQDRHYTLRVS